MLDTISPPAVDRYVPADDEDELSESPTHNAQMDLTLDGLRQACAAWKEPFYVLGNVEVLAEGLP
ncbi:MAG: hypothetical protein HYV63_32185, partial [Candidatus Schekmanbacteria bacterium]|nr:hypothetical protein [Candidatus Schekmanbacteria bacterium]